MKIERWALVLITVLVAGIAFVTWKLYNAPPRYNWGETLRAEANEPYDLSLFHSSLKSYFDSYEFLDINGLHNDTAFASDSSSTIIFAGWTPYMDSMASAQLLRYVERGNTVLAIGHKPDWLLSAAVDSRWAIPEGFMTQVEGDSLRLSVVGHPREVGPMVYAVRNRAETVQWDVLDTANRFNFPHETLGHVNIDGETFVNYLGTNYGHGRLLVHTTPLPFTNYYFRKEAYLAYVESVLEEIPEGTIYYARPYNGSRSTGPPMLSEGPLQLILSHSSLRWAWYGAIALAVLFVWNGARRDRRAVPVIALPGNQTLDYLDVVQRMYRREKNHKYIVAMQFDLLKSHLRRRYHLNFEQSDSFYAEARYRLEMEESYLRRFFAMLSAASHLSGMTDKKLKEIDLKITEFYESCP